jgi:hypothetical protein
MSSPIRLPYASAIFEDFHFLTDPALGTEYQARWAAAKGYAFNEVSQLMAEAEILREWCDDNSRHLPAHRIEYHYIRYATLLMSWRTRKGTQAFIPEPWYQENVWCWFRSMKEDRAGSCFFGNQNQGKSEFFCLQGVCLGCLHPHSTNQIMIAPVKADRTASIWGRFLEVVKGTSLHCAAKVAALGASINLVESSGVVYFSDVRPGGFVRLQAAAECGSIQGTKEREDGFLIHYLDEIGNDYPKGGADWLATIPNISSNNRYFCILSANPRNQIGGLDSEMEPAEGWASQTEHDYFWKAGQHNINVYRRAGHQSPNFQPAVGGLPIDEAMSTRDPKDKRLGLHGPFPWLYNGRRENKLLSTVNGNRNDPRYKEQALGMMPAMNLTLRVITPEDVRGSGMDLPFFWAPAPGEKDIRISRVAFLDPAKTAGGDRIILTLLEAGFRSDGDDQAVPNIFIKEQMELVPGGKLKVDHQWLVDAEMVRRKDKGNGSLGDPVSLAREMAMLAAKQCLEWKVPFANFGFDDTMSGEIGFAMAWAFGLQCTTLSFGGQASRRPIMPRKWTGEGKDRRPVLYCDLHAKHVSELYSRLSHWMRGGYLRMNQKAKGQRPDRWIRETIQRLCKRRGETGYDVESKIEYKARKNQISPDYADSLIGALHMVEVKGLIKVEAPVGDGDDDGWSGPRKSFAKDLTMKNFHAA